MHDYALLCLQNCHSRQLCNNCGKPMFIHVCVHLLCIYGLLIDMDKIYVCVCASV